MMTIRELSNEILDLQLRITPESRTIIIEEIRVRVEKIALVLIKAKLKKSGVVIPLSLAKEHAYDSSTRLIGMYLKNLDYRLAHPIPRIELEVKYALYNDAKKEAEYMEHQSLDEAIFVEDMRLDKNGKIEEMFDFATELCPEMVDIIKQTALETRKFETFVRFIDEKTEGKQRKFIRDNIDAISFYFRTIHPKVNRTRRRKHGCQEED